MRILQAKDVLKNNGQSSGLRKGLLRLEEKKRARKKGQKSGDGRSVVRRRGLPKQDEHITKKFGENPMPQSLSHHPPQLIWPTSVQSAEEKRHGKSSCCKSVVQKREQPSEDVRRGERNEGSRKGWRRGALNKENKKIGCNYVP